MNEAGPEMRPLGLLAVGVALLSVALSVTYFYSPFALLFAVLAFALGIAARTDPATRRLGLVAILLSAVSSTVSWGLLIST